MILAADIGGTKIAAARLDSSLQLLSPITAVHTPAQSGGSAVAEACGTLLERIRESGDRFVAISTAGVVDQVTGRIGFSTSSFRGWTGTPLRDLLAHRTGMPTFVVGDGNAFGVGLSTDLGIDSLVAAVVGTGIGGSCIVNGVPLYGAQGFGGFFGHISSAQALGMMCPCGSPGHLEAVASGIGIVAYYRKEGGSPSVRSMLELAQRVGDPIAERALSVAGTALGSALAGLVNVLDPGRAFVAASVSGAGETWTAALSHAYREGLIPGLTGTPLEVVPHGVELALRGVATLAVKEFER